MQHLGCRLPPRLRYQPHPASKQGQGFPRVRGHRPRHGPWRRRHAEARAVAEERVRESVLLLVAEAEAHGRAGETMPERGG